MPNLYRIAPTWLHNAEGGYQLFMTQKEVDDAWANGWYGPANLLKNLNLISEKKYTSKMELMKAVSSDSRYAKLSLYVRDSIRELMTKIREFEEENEIDKIPRED